jgi:methionyl-tRNA formyltransferase
LPKYKGLNTGNYILINGESESGVTVHFMDEGIDTGDIILQKSYKLSVFDTAKSLARKSRDFEPDVVLDALVQLKEGTYSTNKQEKIEENYKDRTPEDSEIDPTKSISEQYDLIRACHPNKYPAFFYVDGEKVLIKLDRAEKPEDEWDMI